jgi:glucose repression regulatory protein TUP1
LSPPQIWNIAERRIQTVFSGHTQEVYSLDFSRDGQRIVSGSGDCTVRIWNMETGASTILPFDAESEGGDKCVACVAMSPDDRYVAAGTIDAVVHIWDAETGALIERLRGHTDSVYSVVFTPDGRGVVSGSLDKTLKSWDISGLASAKAKEVGAGDKGADAGDEVAQCTRDFNGHQVCCAFFTSKMIMLIYTGLCAVGRSIARRTMDYLRLQGPRRAFL